MINDINIRYVSSVSFYFLYLFLNLNWWVNCLNHGRQWGYVSLTLLINGLDKDQGGISFLFACFSF